ncbi:MAG: spermidine/putrescine ABC transporter substrate-binding protein [Bermanella sp.]
MLMLRKACLLAIILLPVIAQAQPDTVAKTLSILNWDDYLDPLLVAKFERQFKVKIKQSFYESDDYRDELMAAEGGRGYDVVVVSGIMVDSYRRQGWLASKPEMANSQHINTKWEGVFKGCKEYMVPYFWGTLGIAYRQDLVSEPITSWKQFFTPKEELSGKIALINSGRDVVSMALKSLGFSANTGSHAELKEARELLMAFSPHVKTLNYINFGENSAMLSGEVVASMMYSGDTLMLQELSDDISYVLPAEGGNIWVDYIGVTEASTHKELAWTFINFLNEPKNAAQLAQHIYYATPNTAAEKLLPEAFVDNSVIYPSNKALDESEYYQVLSPRTHSRYNSIFSQLKQLHPPDEAQ